jgi:hypothetical protein
MLNNMDEMSLQHKQTMMKTIQRLNSFILKRKHSNLADDIKLVVTTPIGEEIEIYTAADAEDYKNRLEQILSMEKMYAS